MLGRNKPIFGVIIGFICFVSCLFPSTLAQENTLLIKKTKTLFLDYSKNELLSKTIKNSPIQVSFSMTGLSLENNSLRQKLYIISKQRSGTGTMSLEINEKKKIFSFEINIPSPREDFSIRSLLSYTRLQSKPLTCESSALADSMSYLLGKNITEKEIFSLVPKSTYYNKKAEKIDDIMMWGDPNTGFVGYEDFFKEGKELIYPQQGKLTGYGVYEKPLQSLVEGNYELKTKIINHFSYTDNYTQMSHLEELLLTVKDGNMVVLWGDWCSDPLYDDGVKKTKWAIKEDNLHLKYSAKNTCDDLALNRKVSWYYRDQNDELQKHTGLSGEHAFYLLGFTGTPQAPTDIKVWDTDTGYHQYPLKEWLRKWDMMDNRSLVIYKK